MKKINLKRLFLILVIISVNLSFGQGSQSQIDELKGTAAGFVKAETIKGVENNLVKALGAEHNSKAVSATIKKMWASAKGLNKQQAKKLFERFANASESSLREFSRMSPSRLSSYVRNVTHNIKLDSRTLKNIIYGAGDKAGNATLKVMARIDKTLAETGTVSFELLKKMKSEASNLDPKRASAVYDLFEKKLSKEWSELKDLKDTKSGLGKYVGTVVDGVFVLNDAINIYYSDDDPEVKAIQATAKIIDYGSGTAAGAASAALGGGLGPGLVIAFSANRLSTLYTEIAMLQKEREDAKNAEKNEKIDNGILVRRQLVNIGKKIELGQLRNADFLINRLQKFLLKNNVENATKLMGLTKDLEAKSKKAQRNEKINGILNKARSPYSKALYYYKRGVELNIAKLYASEALAILNNNLSAYPEIGELKAIPNVKKLIKAIDTKINNAPDMVITGTNAPKKVYTGQFIEIGVFVNGGIPYYHSAGALSGNISDDKVVTFYWQAPSKPGKEILNFRVADCMGSTASTSASIEVVENIENIIVDNSPEGLTGCWIGWSVCGYKDIKCPMFQYFFKVKVENEIRFFAIQCWIEIINNKVTYHCDDGMADDNIKDKIITGSGWELFKFSYPNMPEIPEISNELYQNKIIEFTRQLKETKDENEQISLRNYINSMNERIKIKDLSSVFYETAILWTSENKWSKFDYANQNSDDYNGYSNWWVCPDDVLKAFNNSVNNNK